MSRGPFRSAFLNSAGWSALVGSTVVVGTGAAVAARLLGRRPWPFLTLGLAVPGVVLVVDRRRYAAIPTSLAWGGSPEETRAVAARLAAAGMPANVQVTPGIPVDVVDRVRGVPVTGTPTGSLVLRSGDLRRARPPLVAWGIPVEPSA